MAIRNRRASVLAALPALLGACSSPARKIEASQLPALHAEATAGQHRVRARMLESMTRRVQRKLEAAEPGARVPIDLLVLSGGGEYGAFGAGVLNGWSKIADPERRLPPFDVVTGISTGSLIAPFAFLGDSHSLDEIVQLYEQVDDSWAVAKATFFFWPWREAFYDRTALDDYIDARVDQAMIAKLAAAGREDRVLLVGSTNLDLGRFHCLGPDTHSGRDRGRRGSLAAPPHVDRLLGDTGRLPAGRDRRHAARRRRHQQQPVPHA